jgi:hypothetical protein
MSLTEDRSLRGTISCANRWKTLSVERLARGVDKQGLTFRKKNPTFLMVSPKRTNGGCVERNNPFGAELAGADP